MKIDHSLRKSLYIGILEFAIADIIQSFKKPVTFQEIADMSDENHDTVQFIVQELISVDYVQIAPRSGKVTVTDLWKEHSKPKKAEKEVNPLINKIKLAIIDDSREVPRPDYQWSAAEARWADQLSMKLKSAYEIKQGEPGTDEKIMESFCLIIDNLTDYWNDGFSVCRLNTFYNDVVSSVRANIRKKQSKGKIVDSAIAIREASSTFVPKTAQDF